MAFRKRSYTWNAVLRLVWSTVTAIAVKMVTRTVMVLVRKTRVGNIQVMSDVDHQVLAFAHRRSCRLFRRRR